MGLSREAAGPTRGVWLPVEMERRGCAEQLVERVCPGCVGGEGVDVGGGGEGCPENGLVGPPGTAWGVVAGMSWRGWSGAKIMKLGLVAFNAAGLFWGERGRGGRAEG